MTAHVQTGSREEIVESLGRLTGEVREAIVFVDESQQPGASMPDTGDIFAEMRPFMVDTGDVDDSREAIYARMDGE